MNYNLKQQYADNNGAYLYFYDAYGLEEIGSIAVPVKFYAFLQSFGDSFSISWEQEEVIGRNDAIATYKNTKRTIGLGWDVPANNLWEAKLNYLKGRILMRMLYPRYKNNKRTKFDSKNLLHTKTQAEYKQQNEEQSQFIKELDINDSKDYYYFLLRMMENDKRKNSIGPLLGGSGQYFSTEGLKHTQTMYTNPLFRVKFANLISDESGGPLIGYLDNLSITTNLEAGFFNQRPCEVQLSNGEKVYDEGGSFPKVFSLTTSFHVLHTDPLGFDELGAPYSKIYYY